MEALEFNKKLNRMLTLKVQIKEMTEEEKSLRDELVSTFDPSIIEGTENLELANGYKLKCEKKITRGLTTKKEDEINNVLDLLPDDVAERIVKWQPELSVSDYKKLCDEHRGIIDSIVVSKPGSSVLKLVQPKVK
jgi:hypothetical protein